MKADDIRILLEELRQLKNQELSRLVLDDNDLVQILKVSKRTLATYRTEGLINYAKVSGRIYYTWQDVQDFIDNHRIENNRHERA